MTVQNDKFSSFADIKKYSTELMYVYTEPAFALSAPYAKSILAPHVSIK